MAKPIMAPRVVRGNLLFQVADVQFPHLTQALCAASAVHALQAQRAASLAYMRRAGDDFEAFCIASKREAELAAQIRRQKRLATAAQS